MLPTDLVATLDQCAATNLAAPRDHWFNLLAGFTTLVAAGLVFELPELRYELRLIAREWIPYFRYRIISYTHREHAAKVLAFIGWVLIVVGVAGERIAEVKVKDFDVRIQECSDAKVTAATLQAGDAAASARTAHEEADAVKGIADEARADAKDALAKAQAAQRELAHAEADAAKAQAAASNAFTTATDASARATKAEASLGKAETESRNAESSALNALSLAREAKQDAASFEGDLARLKKRAEDRVLEEYQQERVALKISAFLGTPYELGTVDTSEAENLLIELDAVLSSAGWIYKPSEDTTTFRFVGHIRNNKQFEIVHGGHGVEIGLSKVLKVRFQPAADGLAKALNFEEISARVVALPDNDPSPNNIHIMVLGKP